MKQESPTTVSIEQIQFELFQHRKAEEKIVDLMASEIVRLSRENSELKQSQQIKSDSTPAL